MTEYTAQDGLNLLSYLDITLPKKEIEVFKNHWELTYSIMGDIVDSAWKIYADIIPFTVQEDILDSITQSVDRDYYMMQLVAETDVGERLEEGVSLDQILCEKSWEITKTSEDSSD